MMLKPGSETTMDDFFPGAAGMLLVPGVLLILSLLFWKKAKESALPPRIK